MATITMQRDLVLVLKKETSLNIGILSKLKPIPTDLSNQVFNENALDKPTQNFFNHLSHYLVSIVDHQVSSSLPWPLYDTKTERAYRNELSNFISDYSNKGLLSLVMSSYLVNPGCYKVTMLMFQLSQLAVQRLLVSKMCKDRQKKLYDAMTATYKSNKKDSFLEDIDRETEVMLRKFSNYLRKKEAMEKIAGIFRDKITQMEHTLSTSDAQKTIDDIVDKFVCEHTMDKHTKDEILKIKCINSSPAFFDDWLADVDVQISAIEHKWNEKIGPFKESCETVSSNTKALISRHMGEVDRHTYMIEYNHDTDEICTKELQLKVNSEQKYILKNIVRDDKLYFPNLIRGFLVAICFVLKNAEISDDIYKFNEYLDNGKSNFNEMASALKILLERVNSAEESLQPSPLSFTDSLKQTPKQILELPPIPDLSDIRSSKCLQNQIIFDTFTPLNTSKYQFNLLRRKNHSFTKPQQMSLLATPYHHGPREDFLKSIISCRVSTYDRPNANHNFLNASIMSHANKANETIAECGTGFTKQQILRLLSTKKSSSSKKFKHSLERPDIKIKKGGLFNESNTSSESNGLFRSYSSPNLFENREKRSFGACRRRKLSIMPEDSPSILEVSGIVALDKDSNQCTPQPNDSPRKHADPENLPKISIAPDPEQKFNEMVKDVEIDFMKYAMKNESTDKEIKTETPKNNTQLIRKTSSLEKIINRFKKVRASVLPLEKNDDSSDFKTIVEEKENLNVVNVDVFTAHRILLPDLLSPSCSAHSVRSMDYLDHICYDMDEKAKKKPRESLGTALGVDQTFLDQFELID
ncbi:uncharacterized protein LOC115447099 [Manduca sexta]|uniref:HAUS augmin-like complex subunit 6 N-terminal domain-containing protein n=1 Tax=Manduca sexta TaxID=7130 RepID=A0A921ZF55_MANSE|nr:uncharacterized protein LOC115447099 [Manduca sexta]KAG6455717.1 hypothetical protein O3G_MSEX009359 [Manduca sexta]